MTKQVKLDMFSMRLDGYTLQEIADRYGISKERVRQVMKVGSMDKKMGESKKKWVYPNAIKWAERNHISVYRIAADTGITPNTLHNALKGKHQPNKTTIDALLRVSGMTYEEFFYQPGKEEGECQPSSQS